MNNFQYDSCIAKGICSVSPRTSALITVLVLYLKIISKYLYRLFKENKTDNSLMELILNASTLIVQGQEFSETGYLHIIEVFKKVLPELIDKYKTAFGEDCFQNEEITSSEVFNKTNSITDSIILGERIFRNISEKVPPKIRNYYQIMLVLAKSLSINLLDFKSYGENSNAAFEALLKIYNCLSPDITDESVLKDIIIDSAKINNKLMLMLRDIQEEQYGLQTIKEVEYSTVPSKAILVVGSNIKELEIIADSLKDTQIDIYTHDDMILAHTFPKFGEYKNLKGQFGQGTENCLIDFATFPGPIIITKHSLHNIENLYRGRLFTTDSNVPNGVIQIINNDFTGVIESANSSKGFKKGKVCEKVEVGYNFEDTKEFIKEKTDKINPEKFVIIGPENRHGDMRKTFEKIIKQIPENVLIISFSHNAQKDNLIHINTCFDSVPMLNILNFISEYGLQTDVLFPNCDKNTISQMIYLSSKDKINVYAGKCTPIILNPSLMETLEKDFNIKSIKSFKPDQTD